MRLLPLTLVAALFSTAALAQGALPASLLASCEGCHGANGQTRTPETPRLNGQTRTYLAARLKDLRNPGNQTARAIHAMLGPSRSVSDDAINALAEHFASQAPTAANPAAPNRAAGQRLYAQGRGVEVVSCAGCHGANGEGKGEAPRLAGQHAAYLIDQMESLMLTARVQAGMNKHTWALTPEDIRALSAFLAKD